MSWDEHAEREERRYADGLARLPEHADARQRELVHVATAAAGAGLSRAMQGRAAEAAGWLARAAERYRESYADAPPGSFGRLLGAVKARVLAGDWERARADAEWALAEVPPEERSPTARYAAALAALVLEDDDRASASASALAGEPEERFPEAVGRALAALAAGDEAAYRDAATAVLESFEARDAFLDDVPVADTVAVLEALARRRGIAASLESRLLPSGPS